MQRKISLSTDNFYHIYNRGVDKRIIFLKDSHYSRFISLIDHYLKYDYPYSSLKKRLEQCNSPKAKQLVLSDLQSHRIKPPVEVISFCLMPNHYHLTLKQLTENGITQFLHRIGTAYSNFFNMSENRTGRLFETKFKSVMVETEEQLIHLSRYQHLNPTKLNIKSPIGLLHYPWSSLPSYIGPKPLPFVNTQPILSLFHSSQSYFNFILAEIGEYEPSLIEHLAIDNDLGWFTRYKNLKTSHSEKTKREYLQALVQ